MASSDPLIRMIHHLSARGAHFAQSMSRRDAGRGSPELIASSAPSVAPFYSLDPLGQSAWNYAHLLPSEERMYSLCLERLEPVVELCRLHGKKLVLRDHSHSDSPTERPPGARLADALRGRYLLRQIVTIRNPTDAWLSMVENGFAHQLTGFEQYREHCSRFLDDYSDVLIWRYEDFVAEPDQVIAAICEELSLVFLPGFAAWAANVVLTGDSGRRPPTIGILPRREVSKGFLSQDVRLSSYRSVFE